jgi:hypothetical protein
MNKTIRRLAAIIALINGIINLVPTVAFGDIIVFGLFGIVYVILAIGLFLGLRGVSFLVVVAPLSVLIKAVFYFVSPLPLLPPLIALDIALLALCIYLIAKKA